LNRSTKQSKSYGIYRSGLEKKFAELTPRGMFKFEPYTIPYTIHRNYKPDFVFGDYPIECKGYFRVGDTQKYTAIRDSLAGQELIFVLSDPNKKLRKGAKMTMGQWCDKEELQFFTLQTIDDLLKYVKDF
jgi:hypothetical protein